MLNAPNLIILAIIILTIFMVFSATKIIKKVKPNNSTSASRIQNDLIGRKRK